MLPLSPPEDTLYGSSPLKVVPRCQSSSDEDQQSNQDASNPLSVAFECSVKTHFYLVCTLNESFHPDYDFSSAPSTDFSREVSVSSAVNSVDNLLLTLGGSYYTTFKPKLWEEIDREIHLKQCEIYKFSPDLSCGPFAEPGVLWSFNYFFYNKKMKRIVYVGCIARSGYSGDDVINDEEEDLNDSLGMESTDR